MLRGFNSFIFRSLRRSFRSAPIGFHEWLGPKCRRNVAPAKIVGSAFAHRQANKGLILWRGPVERRLAGELAGLRRQLARQAVRPSSAQNLANRLGLRFESSPLRAASRCQTQRVEPQAEERVAPEVEAGQKLATSGEASERPRKWRPSSSTSGGRRCSSSCL